MKVPTEMGVYRAERRPWCTARPKACESWRGKVKRPEYTLGLPPSKG
ncbi:hypothetical protein [Acetomicrobium sp.]|nr:hypothetical protein [Acetomicrobium sp.]MDR9770604.1 hypothetical protein [Acetomicrobium sp.]